MTWRSDNLLKKLNHIETALVPEGSFLDSLRSLSGQDRKRYDSYKRTLKEFYKNQPGEQAYIELLAHVAGESSSYPDMPYTLNKKLYPINYKLSVEERYHQLLEEIRFI